MFDMITLQPLCYLLAECLMATIHIEAEQSHAYNLEKEVADRNVKQAEQEEPEGTEVEGQQSVPRHEWQ
jgi:hypothetical protein